MKRPPPPSPLSPRLRCCFVAACRKAEVPANAPSKPAIAAEAAPTVGPTRSAIPCKGVVTKVDPARAQVTVQHEEIPGYMSAMTMAFPIRDDPKVIAFLRPGDRIEARLVVDGRQLLSRRGADQGLRVRRRRRSAAPASSPSPTRASRSATRSRTSRSRTRPAPAVRLSQFRGAAGGRDLRVHALSRRDGLPAHGRAVLEDRRRAREGEVRRAPRSSPSTRRTTRPRCSRSTPRTSGADPKRWKFLTGDAAGRRARGGELRRPVLPRQGQIVHSQAVAIVDPDGKLATIYYGEQWEPETVLRDLQKARKG